jgi:outer membrane protein assembly factor BamB
VNLSLTRLLFTDTSNHDGGPSMMRSITHAGRTTKKLTLKAMLAGSALGTALSFGAVTSNSFAGPAGPVAGEVLWTTQLDGPIYIQFIAVAPDGTIYVNTRTATYAINARGDILWSNPIAPADGVPHSISVGVDGTIYTGMGVVDDMYSLVVALNPDGSIKWQYLPPEAAVLITGPNVGQDGNIYGLLEMWDDNSNHAFSLDPKGNLRWMTAGDLPVWPTNNFNGTSDVKFGDDFMITGHIKIGYTHPTLHAFSIDGDFLWSTASLNPATTSMPAIDSDNRVICTWGQTGIRALAANGQQEWFTLHPDGANFLQRPAVDSNGVIYIGDFIGVDLWALNPDGSSRWVLPTTDEIMAELTVTPDDQFLIVRGNSGADGPFWIRGYSTVDGELLWQVDLQPAGEDFIQLASAYDVAFSPDATVAYVTTTYTGDGIEHGNLYAIHLADPASVVGDLTGDGNINVDDLMMVINNWGTCEACVADVNNDCTVDVNDLLMVINQWN